MDLYTQYNAQRHQIINASCSLIGFTRLSEICRTGNLSSQSSATKNCMSNVVTLLFILSMANKLDHGFSADCRLGS